MWARRGLGHIRVGHVHHGNMWPTCPLCPLHTNNLFIGIDWMIQTERPPRRRRGRRKKMTMSIATGVINNVVVSSWSWFCCICDYKTETNTKITWTLKKTESFQKQNVKYVYVHNPTCTWPPCDLNDCLEKQMVHLGTHVVMIGCIGNQVLGRLHVRALVLNRWATWIWSPRESKVSKPYNRHIHFSMYVITYTPNQTLKTT